MKLLLPLLPLLLFTIGSISSPLHAQVEQQELEQVQQQIKLTEQQLRQQQQQLEQAEQALQQADRELATAVTELNRSRAQQSALQQREAELKQQQQTLQQSFDSQQAILAEQLKSAYSLGQHDYTRLLLNQQDAAKLERVLTYYQYFNRARMQQLAQIQQTVTELQQVAEQLAEQQQQLAITLQQLQQQQQQLSSARAAQQSSVTKLQKVLKDQGTQLSYLRNNESSLQATIEQLQRQAMQQRELTGLTAVKGQLRWPLAGRLSQRFGERRQGGMQARGVIIQATAGAQVQAIADGRVIYADWLKGYGWVIVLDHGAGFMSLYGHNQNLLKQPGDNIAAGEAIALAGVSGGQAEAGLYFEIREKGEAVNPLPWLTRSN
ncbi:murein hydrolase activator EnvC family protein [Arsukibacterium sp.]|uniref:murein hydrolase activator EnvC family protein n=1 Tax=Arsukibacterium sp. TaxID=1977258 RepID=UPI002FD92CE3